MGFTNGVRGGGDGWDLLMGVVGGGGGGLDGIY